MFHVVCCILGSQQWDGSISHWSCVTAFLEREVVRHILGIGLLSIQRGVWGNRDVNGRDALSRSLSDKFEEET